MRPIYVRSTAEAGIKEVDAIQAEAKINEADILYSRGWK